MKQSNKEQSTKSKPKKHWYVTETEACVLCGREKTVKYRVYEKPEYPIVWRDYACPEHFM